MAPFSLKLLAAAATAIGGFSATAEKNKKNDEDNPAAVIVHFLSSFLLPHNMTPMFSVLQIYKKRENKRKQEKTRDIVRFYDFLSLTLTLTDFDFN